MINKKKAAGTSSSEQKRKIKQINKLLVFTNISYSLVNRVTFGQENIGREMYEEHD